MAAYFKFISMAFQRSLAYRVEYFTAVLNAFLYIFIFTSVWRALIPESGIAGLTRREMIAYAVFSTLIKVSFGRNDSLISARIRSGEIAVDLLKPFSLPMMYLCDTIGSSLFQLLARAFPLLLFCVLFFDIDFPTGQAVLRFLPIYFMSFALFFLNSFLISTTAFFFVDIFPFWIFYYALITLASGAIIPLDFFPPALAKLLLWTPFPYLFYFPSMVLMGRPLAFGSIYELMGAYVVIILVTLLISRGLYTLGLRKVTLAGG
ncbi:MAG: ABC-2 family transporter protein [Spirochaetia bacterium]|nr:ABC-2 family transporter protein [Spirochaetia bacterium]